MNTVSRVRVSALVSATAAPILLIGGWSLAAAAQPSAFDSTRDTISALASAGATDRWIMTAAIVLLGCCHLTTAYGLAEAATTGRIVLAAGGAATIGVAMTPLPASGSSTIHGIFAFLAFGCLAIWPFFAWRRGPKISWGLRPIQSNVAAILLVLLLIVFTVSLAQGDLVGATERLAAGAQALWPAAVVWCARCAPSVNQPQA